MGSYVHQCEVCGSEKIVTTFSRIDMQTVCGACDSAFSTYFRKDGKVFAFPKSWGRVISIEVETSRMTDAYEEVKRRTDRIGEVCRQVLEGRLEEKEGFAKIEKEYQEIVYGSAPSYLIEQAIYYLFEDEAGNLRRAKIAKSYFEQPKQIEGKGEIDAYHYWVVDMLPRE